MEEDIDPETQQIREAIGRRIQRRRRMQRMDQRTLGQKIGLSQTEVSMIENGKRPLHVDRLVIAAKALKCSAAYLIGEEDLVKRVRGIASSEK